MVFDFYAGRGGKHATEFLRGWAGTLVVDAYSGYDAALSLHGRSTAYCLAHARRKYDELVKAGASVVADQAIQRIARLYKIEADARPLGAPEFDTKSPLSPRSLAAYSMESTTWR